MQFFSVVEQAHLLAAGFAVLMACQLNHQLAGVLAFEQAEEGCWLCVLCSLANRQTWRMPQ